MTERRVDVSVVERLERAVDELGSSKAELARYTERSDVAVNGWFKPKRKDPRTLATIVSGLNSIAAARGLLRRWTVAELLGEAQPDPYAFVVARSLQPDPDDLRAVVRDEVQQHLSSISLPANARHLSVVSVPVLGHAPCGTPLVPGDHAEMADILSSQLPGDYRETWFALWADGDSMVDWGIADGELMLVDPTVGEYEGKIVVAVINGETTVKRYRRQGDTVVLSPSSDRHRTIVVTERDEFRVCGVVRWSLPAPRAVV